MRKIFILMIFICFTFTGCANKASKENNLSKIQPESRWVDIYKGKLSETYLDSESIVKSKGNEVENFKPEVLYTENNKDKKGKRVLRLYYGDCHDMSMIAVRAVIYINGSDKPDNFKFDEMDDSDDKINPVLNIVIPESYYETVLKAACSYI